jgi:hypothetical protein
VREAIEGEKHCRSDRSLGRHPLGIPEWRRALSGRIPHIYLP